MLVSLLFLFRPKFMGVAKWQSGNFATAYYSSMQNVLMPLYSVCPLSDGKIVVSIKYHWWPNKLQSIHQIPNIDSKYAVFLVFLLTHRSRVREDKTRHQKHHLEGNGRQDVMQRCCATWLELITTSIITVGSIWHKPGVRLFTFWKISTAVLRILWRHLPTELRNVQRVAEYIWSSDRRRKQCSNRCIIGVANSLSFLKLVKNWPKTAVLNLGLCCGAI